MVWKRLAAGGLMSVSLLAGSVMSTAGVAAAATKVQSQSFGGYVEATTVGSVSATFSVPTVDCADAPFAAAELAPGIGVANTDDYGEAITYSINCAYPPTSFVVEFDSGTNHTQPFSVAPGDTVDMSIADNTAAGDYTLSATDETSSATYTVTEGDDTGNSNASVGMSDFGGPVPSFSPAIDVTDALVDGQPVSKRSGPVYQLYRNKRHVVETSKAVDGSFSLTFLHQ